MAAAEELEEGVEVEEKDEEALAVRRRERSDLEGIPVEGSQFGVYGRERERNDGRRGPRASSLLCAASCGGRGASGPCCRRCRATCCVRDGRNGHLVQRRKADSRTPPPMAQHWSWKAAKASSSPDIASPSEWVKRGSNVAASSWRQAAQPRPPSAPRHSAARSSRRSRAPPTPSR